MQRYPLWFVTGFLGAGKSTFIRQLLQEPDFSLTAIIVNEFGEIGIDGAILEDRGAVVEIANGCVCCELQGDLVTTLAELQQRAESGEIPRFRRVIIETSGVSNPLNMLLTLSQYPWLREHWQCGPVITLVRNGIDTLFDHEVAVQQAAVADVLLVSGADLGPVAETMALLTTLNPSTKKTTATSGCPENMEVFRQLLRQSVPWQRPDDDQPFTTTGHEGYCSVSVDLPGVLDPSRLEATLAQLCRQLGPELLRIKGLLNLTTHQGTTVLQGVLGQIEPPSWLPEARQSSVIVSIAKSDHRDVLEQQLNKLNTELPGRALEDRDGIRQ